ncbi:MAG: GPW/gp25 family protein [Bacteroidota bacterium]
MANRIERAYLGRGWSFPPSFEPFTGQVGLVQEEIDVQESLSILLGTRPGERVMRPDFGCNLDVMLFEPLTTTLITVVKDLIQTSILYFEPRIDVLKINIDTTQTISGIVVIEIDYRIRNTNSRSNFVYPFYLEEGTERRQNL